MSIEELPVLEGPYEFLDIPTGTSVTLHPIRFEIGRAQTHPPWTPPGTLIWYKIVRIHVPTTDKPTYPHRWDIGQKTLVPQLEGILPRARAEGVGITIGAVGEGAKKRFSVSLETV